MLKNYLKIAWRNLRNQKGYASINIIGLAVGLATCIIILLYVSHELSYDKHHENADRIYRVAADVKFQDNSFKSATQPAPMGPTLERDFPEVERAVRFRHWGSSLIRSAESNSNHRDGEIMFADAGIFDLFTLPMIHGDPATALRDPYTIVISASAAERHFGTLEAVGETLVLGDEDAFTVTGVIEDMPETSHFHYDFFVSMEGFGQASGENWLSFNFHTYLLLREGVDPEVFEEKFELFKTTYIGAQLREYFGLDFNQFEVAGNRLEYFLQPLTDIHLHSDLDEELEANGSILYVTIFSGLALFVLLLACINFMNLATARSAKRGREVGVRRTLGSLRGQLTAQFLSESVLMSVIAFFIALLLVELTLPLFNTISGNTITNDYFSRPLLMCVMIGIVLMTGLLAGSYPALMLSSMKPVNVLKGSFTETRYHIFFRKGLVVFQFTMSIVIIVGLLVINRQLDFIQTRDLGFQKDQVVILNDARTLGDTDRLKAFRDEMTSYTIFEDGTVTGYYPVDGYVTSNTVYWPEGREPSGGNSVILENWVADEHYIPTLGMEIVDGRNFSEELDAQNSSVILTESTVQRLGIENPVGTRIHTYGVNSSDPDEYNSYSIVGVVRDFHFQSLRQNIEPLGLFYGTNSSNIAFKVASADVDQAISLLRDVWSEYAPMQPFSYEFMDQQFDSMYRAENRTRDLMTSFSVLAGFIACLGLFGLSAYSAERRTKEIGVRKVLGASMQSILGLMSKEFLRLILVSFVIAVPVAWFVMHQWLQSFTYRTDIGVMTFLIAGVGTLLVALLTVSWQSVRAAMKDPVASLRTE